MKTAIYPGSFDPITNGHLDVLKRACNLFDKVIIAIAINTKKKPLFSEAVRLNLVEENLKAFPQVQALVFNGLTVDLAREKKAKAIIRGLRAISDFEFEFQLAQMNRHLDNTIETLFLMPNHDHFYTSSQLIKGVSKFSTDRLASFVPPNVLKALAHHFSHGTKA